MGQFQNPSFNMIDPTAGAEDSIKIASDNLNQQANRHLQVLLAESQLSFEKQKLKIEERLEKEKVSSAEKIAKARNQQFDKQNASNEKMVQMRMLNEQQVQQMRQQHDHEMLNRQDEMSLKLYEKKIERDDKLFRQTQAMMQGMNKRYEQDVDKINEEIFEQTTQIAAAGNARAIDSEKGSEYLAQLSGYSFDMLETMAAEADLGDSFIKNVMGEFQNSRFDINPAWFDEVVDENGEVVATGLVGWLHNIDSNLKELATGERDVYDTNLRGPAINTALAVEKLAEEFEKKGGDGRKVGVALQELFKRASLEGIGTNRTQSIQELTPILQQLGDAVGHSGYHKLADALIALEGTGGNEKLSAQEQKLIRRTNENLAQLGRTMKSYGDDAGIISRNQFENVFVKSVSLGAILMESPDAWARRTEEAMQFVPAEHMPKFRKLRETVLTHLRNMGSDVDFKKNLTDLEAKLRRLEFKAEKLDSKMETDRQIIGLNVSRMGR